MTELSDIELMAYLEGEAPEEVTIHLEKCPYCSHRLEVLAGEQALLTTRLFRSACPSSIELGEYQLDKIPPPERMAIARHVRDCPHCRAEVRQLEQFLTDLAFAPAAPGATPTHSVRVLVARLLSGGATGQSQPPAIAPLWAGVRGSESEALIYQVDDVLITIEIQVDPGDLARKALLGLVIGTELSEMEAQLWRQDQPIGSAMVEESGNFILSGVEPGRYELNLRGKDVAIQIQDLQVS